MFNVFECCKNTQNNSLSTYHTRFIRRFKLIQISSKGVLLVKRLFSSIVLVVSQQFYLIKVTQVTLIGDTLPDRLLYSGLLPVHAVDTKEHIESVNDILHKRETQLVFLQTLIVEFLIGQSFCLRSSVFLQTTKPTPAIPPICLLGILITIMPISTHWTRPSAIKQHQIIVDSTEAVLPFSQHALSRRGEIIRHYCSIRLF